MSKRCIETKQIWRSPRDSLHRSTRPCSLRTSKLTRICFQILSICFQLLSHEVPHDYFCWPRFYFPPFPVCFLGFLKTFFLSFFALFTPPTPYFFPTYYYAFTFFFENLRKISSQLLPFTWLSHDYHMTITWSSHDPHMISTCDPHITLISFFFTCFSRVQYYHTSFTMSPSSFYAFPNTSSSFNSNQIIKNLPFFPHQIPHFFSPHPLSHYSHFGPPI